MDSKTTNGIMANQGSAARYYADASGNYLGGWADLPCPVPGAVEVTSPPPTADQKRVGGVWMPTLSTLGASTSTSGTTATVTTPVAGVTVKL
ncbi:hypothetical protein [Methylobacterium sp. Gmos1]